VTFKIGIAGHGSWGKRHFESWKRISNVEIVGVYDPAFRGELFFKSLRDLIQASEVLDVVVPAQSLAEVATQALQAGRHVLIEKPVATSAGEAKRLARLARNNPGCLSMVGFIERFNPVFNKLDTIFRETRKPRTVFCQRSGAPTLVAKQTGVLKDLAIHDIDLLRWMFGDPRSVSVRSIRSFYFGELKLTFKQTQALVISDCLGPKIRRWIVTFDDQTLFAHFEGDKWRLFQDNEEILVTWTPPLEQELRYFAECLAKGRPPSPTIDDAARALEIIERAR
jgi:predicted dehydrogenase